MFKSTIPCIEMVAEKESHRKAIENILFTRASEQLKEPDGMTKFINAFEQNPGSMDLFSILDECFAAKEISEDLWTLYKAQLRKFEADFLRAHSGQIDPRAIAELVAYNASLDITDDLEEKHNLKILDDFGVSTKFRLGK